MKKGIKILCLAVALIAVFLLGWRVMPRIWPGIKENVVYPLFPQYQPTPAPTQEPYHPKTNTAFDDAISASDSVIFFRSSELVSFCNRLTCSAIRSFRRTRKSCSLIRSGSEAAAGRYNFVG